MTLDQAIVVGRNILDAVAVEWPLVTNSINMQGLKVAVTLDTITRQNLDKMIATILAQCPINVTGRDIDYRIDAIGDVFVVTFAVTFRVN